MCRIMSFFWLCLGVLCYYFTYFWGPGWRLGFRVQSLGVRGIRVQGGLELEGLAFRVKGSGYEGC